MLSIETFPLPTVTSTIPPAPEVRLRVVKEEEVMAQDEPETDTSGTELTVMVSNVTDVRVSFPAVVAISEEVSGVIAAVPVKEMAESFRLPAEALEMKDPEETVTVMVVISTLPEVTLFETLSPVPSNVTAAPSSLSPVMVKTLLIVPVMSDDVYALLRRVMVE